MNSAIGDDDEIGCPAETMIRCPDEESGKAVEDARLAESATQEVSEAKKWGGDGHITSPTSSTWGRAHSVRKAAGESYHEHSYERRYNI